MDELYFCKKDKFSLEKYYDVFLSVIEEFGVAADERYDRLFDEYVSIIRITGNHNLDRDTIRDHLVNQVDKIFNEVNEEVEIYRLQDVTHIVDTDNLLSYIEELQTVQMALHKVKNRYPQFYKRVILMVKQLIVGGDTCEQIGRSFNISNSRVSQEISKLQGYLRFACRDGVRRLYSQGIDIKYLRDKWMYFVFIDTDIVPLCRRSI